MDGQAAQDLARRMANAGLKVWNDIWEMDVNDPRYAEDVREGLDDTAVLVVCVSHHSRRDWARFEQQSLGFRDPSARDRRFILLRLDDVTVEGALSRSLYFDWRRRTRVEFDRLVEACWPPRADAQMMGRKPTSAHAFAVGSTLPTVLLDPETSVAVASMGHGIVLAWDIETGDLVREFSDHAGTAISLAADGAGSFLSGGTDKIVRLWSLASSEHTAAFHGHPSSVTSVAFGGRGRDPFAVSGDRAGIVCVWDLASRERRLSLEGHGATVHAIACHPTRAQAATAGADGAIRVWDVETGSNIWTWSHVSRTVWALAYSPSGSHLLSGDSDLTVRLWNLETGACERIFEGHTGEVNTVAYHPDGRRIVSAGDDRSVRVWDLQTGTCEQVLSTDSLPTWSVSFRDDKVLALGEDARLNVWTVAARTEPTAQDQVSYTNAKVVIVGESQAGKSGLAMRLAADQWEHTDSTLGAWASQMLVPAPADGTEREIWLWDFGGQADQRLIHQLYLGDAALALLVFDGQRDDVLPRLWDWNRALTATGQAFPKLLVAGRTDRYPVRLGSAQVGAFCEEAGFAGYIETSAKDGTGCATLRDRLVTDIDWSRVPWRTSPVTFQRLKEEILKLKDSGRTLTTTKELRDWLPTQIGPFDTAELEAVIGLLAGPGAVMRLDFGDYILLQPELINTYAQAVIETLRDDPHERGCVTEERVLTGDLNYGSDFQRLSEADEHVVIHAMHGLLVKQSICLRDRDPQDKGPTLLIFPSYFRRERPDRPLAPPSFMTYGFSGYMDEVYASLVVRLHHTNPFRSGDLWRDAADFRTPDGKTIGVRLAKLPDGSGQLEVHCDTGTATNDRVVFAQYVDDHLRAKGHDVTRLRTYICEACSTPVENRHAARRRLTEGKDDIGCSYCDARVPLWDAIEEKLADPELRATVEEMRREAQIVLDTESRERVLVGEMLAMAASANQIARELTVSDHGIDMEIEFKDDDGRATGNKVYLQLKSGDSHLRERKRDGGRLFRIKNPRHAHYWAAQRFPVMLVVRSSSGEIEWMEIGTELRELLAVKARPPSEIAFRGQLLDLRSLRRWGELAAAAD